MLSVNLSMTSASDNCVLLTLEHLSSATHLVLSVTENYCCFASGTDAKNPACNVDSSGVHKTFVRPRHSVTWSVEVLLLTYDITARHNMSTRQTQQYTIMRPVCHVFSSPWSPALAPSSSSVDQMKTVSYLNAQQVIRDVTVVVCSLEILNHPLQYSQHLNHVGVVIRNKCKKLFSLKIIVRTMWWHRPTKTA